MKLVSRIFSIAAAVAFVALGTAYYNAFVPVGADNVISDDDSKLLAKYTAEATVHAATERKENPELKRYSVVFNSSVRVPYRAPATIKAEIASRSLPEAFMSVRKGSGPATEERADFTGYVRATLTGPTPYVSIDGDGSNVKFVSDAGNAKWTWRIVPRTLRPIDLDLKFFNQIQKDGQLFELPGPSYQTTIRVVPNWTARIQDWSDENQGLLAILAILVPVATGGFGFFVGRWWEGRGGGPSSSVKGNLPQPKAPKAPSATDKPRRGRSPAG